MQEDFYKNTKVSNDKLKELRLRNNRQAGIKFILIFSIFIFSNISLYLVWDKSIFLSILSILISAITNCSLFATIHETIHNTAFESKELNSLTAFLAGIGHIYPSNIFRDFHFAHHRNTHKPGLDPEISLGYRKMPLITDSKVSYFFWLTGLPLLIFKIFMMVCGAIGMPNILIKEFFPFIKIKNRKKIALESIFLIVFYLIIIFAAINIDNNFFSLIVAQLFGHSLLSSYLVMEHNGLSHDGDILYRTRSIKTNSFVKYIMWNMPYHAEHHAYPSIPFHALPKLNKELKPYLKHDKTGYISFHKQILKN